MSFEKIWYAVIQNKADGPHTAQDIQDMLNMGKLHFTDFVFKPGLTQWTPISEFKEFERRNEDHTTTQVTAQLNIPENGSEMGDGWIMLIKNSNSDGQENLIQSGPYTTEQVREKLVKGEFRFDDMIWRSGFKHWTKLGTVEIFDRRRPQTFEKQPKPQFSSDISTNKTVVIEKSISEGFSEEPTQSKESLKIEDQKYETLPTRKRGKSVVIALGGALVAMVFAYVGLDVYKQSLIAQFPVLKTLEFNKVGAENKQSAQPVAITPQLKIVSIKSNTPYKPQIVFETNLNAGASIQVELIAGPGSILEYPQLILKKEIRVISGQMPILDLSQEDLPQGDYSVIARGGGLISKMELKVGVHDITLAKKLEVHRQKLLAQEKREKADLLAATRLLAQENQGLQKLMKDKGKKTYLKSLADWRKSFAKKSSPYLAYTKADSKKVIYSQVFSKWGQAQVKLYEKALPQRGIASISSPAAQEFNKRYLELQSELKNLNFSIK